MKRKPDATISAAVPADAGRLAELRWEFRAPRARTRERKLEFTRRCAAWMRKRIERKDRWRCWVAVRQGKIVGHVWINLIDKIPNPGSEPELHAYLTNLYVQEDERGGVGTALLSAALAWCETRDIDQLVLWPTPKSRSLYLRHGFRPAAWIMARRHH